VKKVLTVALVVIALLLVVVAVSAAEPPEPASFPVEVEQIKVGSYIIVYRVKDLETGTMCYVAQGGYPSVGISCVPVAKEVPEQEVPTP